MRKRPPAPAVVIMSLGLVAAAVFGGCGRTAIWSARPTVDAAGPVEEGADGAGAPDLAHDAAGDAPSDVPNDVIDSAASAPPPPPATPGCQPREEVCNGRDDDCDNRVDEDLVAVPCPGGGSRYCVAGQMSACPRRCDVCLPGSTRVCFVSYCTFWGTNECAPDGRSFGLCRERPVPPECEAVAKSKKRSPELQRCCIDNGYCCLDEFDFDSDGDRQEMLGRCGSVACGS